MKKAVITLLMVLCIILVLPGCVPGDGAATGSNPAGFFWGVWHGWIAPVSLILGIFFSEIRVYESANTGWWYDLGFYIAIISGFGGLSLSRKKYKDKRD